MDTGKTCLTLGWRAKNQNHSFGAAVYYGVMKREIGADDLGCCLCTCTSLLTLHTFLILIPFNATIPIAMTELCPSWAPFFG